MIPPYVAPRPCGDVFFFNGRTYGFFIEREDEVSVELRKKVSAAQLSTEIRVLEDDVLDEWDVHSAYPSGHYVRTLGPIGDRETETQVVLIEHDIPTAEFSPRVMACLPDKDWVVTPDKLAREPTRKDLRHITVCSIDPPGCKDIDDALHVLALDDGNFEVQGGTVEPSFRTVAM